MINFQCITMKGLLVSLRRLLACLVIHTAHVVHVFGVPFQSFRKIDNC